MKNLHYILFLMLIVSCAKESFIDPSETAILSEPLSREQINAQINQEMAGGDIFYWSKASEELIWSAALQSDSVISIGYNLANFNIEKDIHTIDLKSAEWKQKQDDLIAYLQEKDEEVVFEVHPILPQIQFKTSSLQMIKELRLREDIRFVEPLGYNMEETVSRSGSGCDGAPNYSIATSDYSTISPNTKMSWNFEDANIPSAWNTSQGDGIAICILDTGGSFNQDNIGSAFTQGNSGSRSVQKLSTKYSGSWWWKTKDSPNDDCGHGTSMAGLATAPRGTDGNSVGVAYKADLLTIRGTGDVLVNSSNEKKGVRDGLVTAGQRSNIKIISMSIGDVFYSSTVADGIYYAYNNGKLILAAAGTSFSFTNWVGVVFPATMSQTTAITGVKDGTSLQRCSNCHSGSQVDFVLTMEKSSGGSTPITLASSSNQPKYTGGSSCATAMMAGISALVWSTNPSMSRTDVLNRLKNASQYYPARSSQYGWGRVDAAAAVNGN
jgi:hypothetical protein